MQILRVSGLRRSPSVPAVVNVKDANRLRAVSIPSTDHEQDGDLIFVEQSESIIEQRVGRERFTDDVLQHGPTEKVGVGLERGGAIGVEGSVEGWEKRDAGSG